MNGSYFIKDVDGTFETGWEYFYNISLQFSPFAKMFLIGLLLEINYTYIFLRYKNIGQIFLRSLLMPTILLFYFAIVNFKKPHYGGLFEEFLLLYLFYFMYFFAYVFIRSTIEKQKRSIEIRHEQAQSEISALKSQVNPHFFFNTLNNLYGTALQENAPRTSAMIEQLSDMMRYMMSEAQNNFTDIKNELDFIENYWTLQAIRLPDKQHIQVSKHIEYDEKPAKIAPLLLITYIENAFKYGISIDHRSSIDLHLNIKNQVLNMTLSNIIQKENTIEKTNGIGMENTQKRLDLIYADKYTLTQSSVDNRFVLNLEIHLQ